MQYTKLLIALLIGLLVTASCSEEEDLSNKFTGLWQLEQTLEDGENVAMTDSAKMTKILMEINGLYRLYSGQEGIIRYGTWLFTPTERIDLTMDRKDNIDRHNFSKYEPCPVPFVIESITDESFEIMYRNTVDERKRFVMFTPMDDNAIYIDIKAKMDTTTNIDDKTALERQLLDLDQKMVTYSFVFKRINQ